MEFHEKRNISSNQNETVNSVRPNIITSRCSMDADLSASPRHCSAGRWTGSKGPIAVSGDDRGGHRRSLRRSPLLFLAFFLSTCWQTAEAEVVYHRRDHRDQRRDEEIRNNHQVHNYTDAVHYLQKYGYLENCRQRAASRTRRHVPEFMAGITEQVPDCSDEMITEALQLLQRKFDLAPSGHLNAETLTLMSKGRCGNSDVDEAQRRKRREAADLNPERPSSFPDALIPLRGNGESRRSLWKPLASDRIEGKEPLPESEELNSRLRIEYTLYEGVGLDSIEDVDSVNQPRAGSPPDNEPRSSKRRREELLREISDRVQSRSASAVLPGAQVSLTFDEMALLHQKRLSTRSVQRLQRRRRKRRKRTISVLSMGDMSEGSSGDKVKFQKDENSPVLWRILNGGISDKIPLDDQRGILELSFRMWSEVIPLKFIEANDNTDISDVDVVIAFAKETHMNCDKPFDGIGGELAHSWTGGDIHFDEDENYKRVDPSGTGIDLLKVAVHEVGHVLGLLHNDQIHSIMYPIYVNPPDSYDDFELSLDDRRAVQKIYGVCKGSFDVVFDWLRKVPSTQEPHHRPRYIFNTYFFRSNRYWMYENRFNRTRFGDPLYISRGWTGILGEVNAYTQVITSRGHEYNIDTYFFVGDSYYKYNDETDQVVEGYPKKIAADFGAKAGGNDSIPGDLNAVLFDNRDSLLYFFKGDWVWTYDPKLIGQSGCCEGKRRFTELFPVEPTLLPPDEDPLEGSLDSVFYSYHFHTIFFLKGELVYENSAYNEKTPGVNRLRRLGAWYNQWYDICDVE